MATEDSAQNPFSAIIFGITYPVAWGIKQIPHLLAELLKWVGWTALAGLAIVAVAVALAVAVMVCVALPFLMLDEKTGRDILAKLGLEDKNPSFLLGCQLALGGLIALPLLAAGVIALAALFAGVYLPLCKLTALVGSAIYLPLRALAMIGHGLNHGFKHGFTEGWEEFTYHWDAWEEDEAEIDGLRFDVSPFNLKRIFLYQCYKIAHVFQLDVELDVPVELRDSFSRAGDKATVKPWPHLEAELKSSAVSPMQFLGRKEAATRNYDYAHRDEGRAAINLARKRLRKGDALPRLMRFSAEELLGLIDELKQLGLSEKFTDQAERKRFQLAIDRLLRHNEVDPVTGINSRQLLLGYWLLIKQAGYDKDQVLTFRKHVVQYIYSGQLRVEKHDETTRTCAKEGLFAGSADLKVTAAFDAACHERVRNIAMGAMTMEHPLPATKPDAPQDIHAFLNALSETVPLSEIEQTKAQQINYSMGRLQRIFDTDKVWNSTQFAKVVLEQELTSAEEATLLKLLESCNINLNIATIRQNLAFVTYGATSDEMGELKIAAPDTAKKLCDMAKQIQAIVDKHSDEPSGAPTADAGDQPENRAEGEELQPHPMTAVAGDNLVQTARGALQSIQQPHSRPTPDEAAQPHNRLMLSVPRHQNSPRGRK